MGSDISGLIKGWRIESSRL